MTYKDISNNPKDGIYKTSANTYVIVKDNKLIHSPRGMMIADDEILEVVE
jgi:hypothetical protein